MASVSLDTAPAGPSRHARKHSRHPTAAAPLPSFTFNPGSPAQEVDNKEEQPREMLGSGHMRRPSKPAPLPDFSFNPGAALPDERTPSPSHPILEEMALNQQRVSKSARPAPLPAFTFNPSTSAGSTSPTKLDADTDPMKQTGHRRGGSEFVGGIADNAHMVVNSPIKHEMKPSMSGFRGHTHRRSQAISVSDIDTSELIKQHALAKSRAGSNPVTPQESTFSFPRASPSHRHTPSARSPPASPRRRGSATGCRPRIVDFSEKIDVIPRPLSMISSETERSNSTIRGHSVTNSINSIASSQPISSPQVEHHIRFITQDAGRTRRPNTADASLLLRALAGPSETDLLAMPKRPLSASGSPATLSSSPPLKKKHFWSAQGNDPSPTPTPKVEKDDPMEIAVSQLAKVEKTRVRPKTAPERVSPNKRHKYHTWTAGFFGKKSKQRAGKKTRRSPTPPSMLRRDSDQLNDIFDADNTVVLCEEPPMRTNQIQLVRPLNTSLSAPGDLSEISSPVIDLDAALPMDDDRRHSDDHSRNTTARIAKLHSSERRGVVDAFGVAHRRTESAPALSPVNRSGLFGMRHRGSNASLGEDVFDEEEEDNFLAHEQEIESHIKVDNTDDVFAPTTSKEDGLGLTSVADHVDVFIVDHENMEADDLRSSKSTIDAPVVTETDIPKRPSTSPMPFAYPDPQLHYASSTDGRTTTASLISSPDADHASFDIQPRPRRFGEMNSDLIRPSNEDLPSLSDSLSSNAYPRGSSSGNARPSLEHRSNSMFVPGSSRLHESWKRSSLASLNRLIPGSAHGSKTKLDKFGSEINEKSKRRSNRISKLMRFWRSKETEETP